MKALEKYGRSGLVLSLYLISFTIPYSYKISNPWIVLMFAFWLLYGISHKFNGFSENWTKWDRLSFFSMIGFFLLHAISLTYTQNLDFGIKGLEGKLSLLAFPLVLFSFHLKKEEVWRILKVFIISIFLATLYLFFNSARHYFSEGSWLIYHDFSEPLDAHPIFYSYYLFLSILVSTFILINQNNSSISKTFYFLVILLSLTALVFSASKNVTIVSIFFALLLLFKRYVKRGIKWKELTIMLSTMVVLVILASNLSLVQSRMAELSSGSGMENLQRIRAGERISETDNHSFNGTSLRLTFWYLGLDKLKSEERYLIGLSPGDRRDQMNERYLEAGLRPYQNYNLHNQFVQVLVELGVAGLLVYLLIYIGLIGSAINKSNSLLLIFIAATIIFQLTESILERNKSIVFFLFFFCLLHQLSHLENHEDRDTRN